MSTTVVLGAQWGDEGKGKVTDFFASTADYVVRFQGGNNAGHTIVVGEDKVALSLTPSGVLYPSCTPVIGSGCVCLLYTSPSPRDRTRSRMPSSA